MENNFQCRSLHSAKTSIIHDEFILRCKRSQKKIILFIFFLSKLLKIVCHQSRAVKQDKEKNMEHRKQEIQHMIEVKGVLRTIVKGNLKLE